MGQEPGHGLAGSSASGSLMRQQARWQLRLRPPLKAQLGKDLPLSSLKWLLARFRSPWAAGLKPSADHCLLAGGSLSSWPRGPLRRAAHNTAADGSERASTTAPTTGATILPFHLWSDIPSPLQSPRRSESVSPSCHPGEGTAQRRASQGPRHAVPPRQKESDPYRAGGTKGRGWGFSI